MLRIASVLDDATEALITRIIGICIAVHRELGPGLLESIYGRAICLELETAGLSFEVEKQVPVLYRGIVLCHHRLDIVVDLKVLLEIKAVERLAPNSLCAGIELPANFQTPRRPVDELQFGRAAGRHEADRALAFFFVSSCFRGCIFRVFVACLFDGLPFGLQVIEAHVAQLTA